MVICYDSPMKIIHGCRQASHPLNYTVTLEFFKLTLNYYKIALLYQFLHRFFLSHFLKSKPMVNFSWFCLSDLAAFEGGYLDVCNRF